MTDTNNVDALLRTAFARAAEPGDPSGVVESIRTRMADGDTGTPARRSDFGAGLRWLIPFIAGGLVLAIAGGVLGASGFFGSFVHTVAVASPSSSSASTPIQVVPTPTATPTPTPTQPPPVAPPPPPPPHQAPAPDSKAPAMSVGAFSPDPVYGLSAAPYCSTVTSVSVVATDNVGVSGVTAVTDFANGTIWLASSSGSSYVFNFSAGYDSGSNKTVVATFTASDSAGNSATATQIVQLVSAGNCLI
jgi:hypothetical protein